MTPFLTALVIGFALGVLSAVAVPFFVREFQDRRRLRARTAQHREDERRFARAVASSITTPVPGKVIPLKSRRLA